MQAKRDEETLVTLAGQGDEQAIGALLEKHLPGLRAYIRLRMGARVRRWDTEEDVAQSVCVEVLRGLDGFAYQGEAAFRHWLFTMARRKLKQREVHLRAQKRDVDLVVTNARPNDSRDPIAGEVQRAFGTPSEMAIRGETLERIMDALDAMPEETREVILMSRLAGMSAGDIAARIGKEPATVRVTLCRGLALLGEALV